MSYMLVGLERSCVFIMLTSYKTEEVVMYVDHLEEDDHSSEQSTAGGLSTCIFSQSETWEDVKLSENLSEQEVTKL